MEKWEYFDKFYEKPVMSKFSSKKLSGKPSSSKLKHHFINTHNVPKSAKAIRYERVTGGAHGAKSLFERNTSEMF